ncbi:sodium/proline symporter PutP [Arthrobacter sp. zg-Y1171]|uniref:sodium/proline symporter PutP n=1 Tax=Arthrobacter sp. zg-Y1171 TaxID=2964610 RepID=UPI0021081D06|nr:sodium/proline symporter PutP [Arthrobacter sp. zg-Y1171]MCQ1996420.1 sodium/proline symporter PutP [Arthrobacter sp. zg-Y1171]UWX82541.1 sodium/proline symporter PutP [Arthrobacter sp. zg-Y1171]
MTDQTYKVIAMTIYMLAMLAIGWWAYRKTNSLDDYMLAGRDLKPGVAALSAGASDMSGWLLMGLPGAIYVSGLVEGWIAVGLTVGAWLNWKFVAPRLRAYTMVANNSITVPSFLENRLRDRSRLLRVVSGLIILVFFTFYVSSGMVAGGVFFESSFGSSYVTGMLIVAVVTIAYTLFGGFLAASYTDVVQGLMMVAALVLVPVVGLVNVGGFGGMTDSLREVNPDMLDPIAGGTALGIISALAWGLGYFGQPHIIVRFMALRSPADAKAGRRIGVGWMLFSVIGAVFTALVGVAYFQQNNLTLDEPEAVFLSLAQIFFHPLVAGFVLAAVLAAIMSTISSQLIVTSSALVEDLYRIALRREASPRSLVMLGRLGVLVVSVISILIALGRNDTILDLVGFAWAGFGASFGPTILLALFWRRLSTAGALTGMIAGAVTAYIWGSVDALSGTLYEIVPGFVINVALTVVVSLLTHKPSPEIDAEFNDAVRLAKEPAQEPEPSAVS